MVVVVVGAVISSATVKVAGQDGHSPASPTRYSWRCGSSIRSCSMSWHCHGAAPRHEAHRPTTTGSAGHARPRQHGQVPDQPSKKSKGKSGRRICYGTLWNVLSAVLICSRM